MKQIGKALSNAYHFFNKIPYQSQSKSSTRGAGKEIGDRTSGRDHLVESFVGEIQEIQQLMVGSYINDSGSGEEDNSYVWIDSQGNDDEQNNGGNTKRKLEMVSRMVSLLEDKRKIDISLEK